MTPAIPGPRGCGSSRTRGAVYWECGLDPAGQPLTAFLIDCPPPIPPGLGLTPRGVTLLDSGGVTHVVDWVGSAHYPGVLDFVMEVAALGVSRRLPQTLDFTRLTPASRLLLVQARARVENAHTYGPFPCPTARHAPGTDACVGAWWEDVEGGVPLADAGARSVKRSLPSGTYQARCRPVGVSPQYAPGFFASFPASRLVVVAGGDGRARVAAQRAGLPVAAVDA